MRGLLSLRCILVEVKLGMAGKTIKWTQSGIVREYGVFGGDRPPIIHRYSRRKKEEQQETTNEEDGI